VKEEAMANGQEKHSLSVTIHTGRGSDTREFDKNAKVEEVISWAIERFGLSASEPWEVIQQGSEDGPLEPQRPLVSYGIEDGDVLVVSAAGGGV
jgi:hypothetical protein